MVKCDVSKTLWWAQIHNCFTPAESLHTFKSKFIFIQVDNMVDTGTCPFCPNYPVSETGLISFTSNHYHKRLPYFSKVNKIWRNKKKSCRETGSMFQKTSNLEYRKDRCGWKRNLHICPKFCDCVHSY